MLKRRAGLLCLQVAVPQLVCGLLSAMLLLRSQPAAAATAQPWNRHLLALWDSTERPDPPVPEPGYGVSAMHEGGHGSGNLVNISAAFLEKTLNHLGYIVDYHDVAQRPLPDVRQYAGLVIWLSDQRMVRPIEYLRWLDDALAQGIKLLCVEGFGAELDARGMPVDAELNQRIFARLGLCRTDTVPATDNPFLVEVTDLKPDCFAFELAARPAGVFYECIKPVDPTVEIWRRVRRRDLPDSDAVAVAVGAQGAFVLHANYILQFRAGDHPAVRWDLDPFQFAAAVFGDARGWPIPDVTTAFGRRAAFSHIDGDGIANALVDIGGERQFAGEVVYDEILAKLPLPITVGMVVGRIDPGALGTPQLLELARRIHALPNIQAGCHGYAHPMQWSSGRVGLHWPSYGVYSPVKEIGDAVAFLEREVLPPGQKVEIFLWTGDCRPDAPALAMAATIGLANINGGDARLDTLHPGIAHLAPLSRQVGQLRQVYAAAQNENTYTELWLANFGAFRQVVTTFVRSETPRRLLPVNIYYHFYSGCRLASLLALQQVYAWCQSQALCWLHASEYSRSVQSFFTTRISQDSQGFFVIADYDHCRTVRIDACLQHVEMATAQHVLGYTHANGALYVSLAPAARARFRLSALPPAQPCLLASTSALRAVKTQPTAWQAEARLYVAGLLELRGLPANQLCTASVADRQWQLTSDAAGLLSLELPEGHGQWVEVRLAF